MVNLIKKLFKELKEDFMSTVDVDYISEADRQFLEHVEEQHIKQRLLTTAYRLRMVTPWQEGVEHVEIL